MWKDTIALLADKLRYEENMKRYMSTSYIHRLFLPKPINPTPLSPKEIASNYTLDYYREKGFSSIKKDEQGEYAYISINPNIETFYPELRCVIYSCKCFWISHKLFSSDGSSQELGCLYPYIECGFSLTDQNCPPKFKKKKEEYDNLCEEMKEYLNLINNTF